MRILTTIASVLMLVTSANAESWRMLSSWDAAAPVTQLLAKKFADNVTAATNGEASFTILGPETVPSLEQFEPVTNNVFQFLVTVGPYHSGTTSLGSAMDAIEGTPEQMRSSGVWEWYDEYYRKFNLKLIALPIGHGALQLMLREPLSAEGDLRGRKIRGSQVYLGIFELLGAVPVSMSPAEVYAALERGVIDGAGWGSYSVAATKWHEVAKHSMRPFFGNSVAPIFMNLDAWNGASPELQKILLDEGEKIEVQWFNDFERMKSEDEATLKAAGVLLTEMPADKASGLRSAFMDGIWKAAEAQDPADAASIRSLAKQHGLTE